MRAVADRDHKDEADDNHATEGEAEGHEPEAGEGSGGSDDAAAKRVAAALGVDDGEAEGEKAAAEAAEGAEEEAKGPANRAARRQEAAQRRKRRSAGKAEPAEDADAPLPRDKNARAKELLKRRREQASSARAVQLLPGEMVDDALARGSSAAGRWFRKNFGIIQWVILAGLAAGGGFLFYQSQVDKKAAEAADALAAGVSADRGRVLADDKRSDEEKEVDPTRIFKTSDERTDAALAGYKKVIEQFPSSGAAILARLGEGNAYLDKHDWPKALETFSSVSSSTLAGADPDVRGRALEGLGFAKEGKGDLDGAIATFKELEGVDGRGFKELGMYHQGRLFLAKGDKDKAKELLKQVHDKLEVPSGDGTRPFRYLEQVTDEALRRIDPALIPNKAPTVGGGGKGNAITPEDLERLKKKMQEAAQKKPHEDH